MLTPVTFGSLADGVTFYMIPATSLGSWRKGHGVALGGNCFVALESSHVVYV